MVSTSRFATFTFHLLLLTLMTTAAVCLGAAEADSAPLTASWVDNSSGAATTRLERRQGTATTFTAIADVSGGATQYVDASVAQGMTYCYRVLAYDAVGVSPYSDEVCATSEAVTPLTLSFTNPASAATVSGTATVSLSAVGGAGYTFTVKADGAAIYSGTNGSFTWNTTAVTNGTHTLTATVTDSQSRTATATLTVTVSNVVTPPPGGAGFTVAFSAPASGATVTSTQHVGLATDATFGQTKTFTLSVDGVGLFSETMTGTTFWYAWDTTRTGNGSRTLTATVTMAGQTATATLPVTVSNGSAPLSAAFTAPAPGAGVRGITTIGMASSRASGSSTFKLAVDGVVVSTQTVSGTSATYAWNTTTVPNGARTLTLTVIDGSARTASATIGVTVRNTGDNDAVNDFDGDGKTDLAVYRPATGEWFIFGSSTGLQTRVFGAPASSGLGDVPVPADFDGDGKTDMAIYRQATGEWFIFGSASGFETRVFGAPATSGLGDTAVTADFDGDGKSDLAIYRKATGEWFIFGSATGLQTRVFGAPAASGLGDIPVPGDYDGDGKADMAIYRKATGEWFIFGTASGFQTRVFGSPAASGLGDIPMPADFDGDGKTDLAIYRQATGEWFIFGSQSGFQARAFGAPASAGLGDSPLTGDFDGDGKADIAIFRSTTTQWMISRSGDGQPQTTTWGTPIDIPLPMVAR